MTKFAKDGADVTAYLVVRLYCSKCGIVLTGNSPVNDREAEALERAHILEKHESDD